MVNIKETLFFLLVMILPVAMKAEEPAKPGGNINLKAN